jgi:hypothetical protein
VTVSVTTFGYVATMSWTFAPLNPDGPDRANVVPGLSLMRRRRARPMLVRQPSSIARVHPIVKDRHMSRSAATRPPPARCYRIRGAACLGRTVTAALSALMLLAGGPSAASADSDAAIEATIVIDVPIRSVTVTPGQVTFAECSGPDPAALTIPNGTCTVGHSTGGPPLGGVTVTNTGDAGHILVSGSDAIPSDLGTHWKLCGAPQKLACSAGAGPGLDEFGMSAVGYLGGGASSSVRLSNSLACDMAFNQHPSCGAAVHDAFKVEQLRLTGPSSSSNPSTRFTTHITWTAAP